MAQDQTNKLTSRCDRYGNIWFSERLQVVALDIPCLILLPDVSLSFPQMPVVTVQCLLRVATKAGYRSTSVIL